MIENFHIMGHAIVFIGFFLFVLYARSNNKSVPKNFGKSSVTAFEGKLIPHFQDWTELDKSHVANLSFVLMKLDLADPMLDREIIKMSPRPLRDRLNASLKQRIGRSDRK